VASILGLSKKSKPRTPSTQTKVLLSPGVHWIEHDFSNYVEELDEDLDRLDSHLDELEESVEGGAKGLQVAVVVGAEDDEKAAYRSRLVEKTFFERVRWWMFWLWIRGIKYRKVTRRVPECLIMSKEEMIEKFGRS
jgi:hypothetical protein